MAVNVDEIVSNVTPEPELPATGSSIEPDWRRLSHARELNARVRRDRLRTAAEGFDD
jgi:hypothetical protein